MVILIQRFIDKLMKQFQFIGWFPLRSLWYEWQTSCLSAPVILKFWNIHHISV